MGACCGGNSRGGVEAGNIIKGKSTGVFKYEVNDLEGYSKGTIGQLAHGKKAILFVNVASF